MTQAEGTTVNAEAAGNGFDKLSRPYRWMEYLSFGSLLWRTRMAMLPEIRNARQVLLLGDGDGRFAAALLRLNPVLRIHAVDASLAMLQHLGARAAKQGDAARVQLFHADAREQLPAGCFDLVCSHFFLDCLTDDECGALVKRVAAHMQPSACWVVSEFAIPNGSLQWPAFLLVRSLYVAFGLLTGLRVSRLPSYAAALRNAGLLPFSIETRLGGILRSELWTLDRPGALCETRASNRE